ncbi:MAG: diguanylate cyclase [Gammaproteobacteria bacterium]|nr:MAG: diguanylate cyclase [Gammaproteobacteria bacterium]
MMDHTNHIDIKEWHWMMDMLQNIDVGLVVLDRDYKIQVWNGFMENHSGLSPSHAIGKDLFKLFDEIPASWFKRKVESVFLLNNRAFTTWEQRPYLFKFKNYRPITGLAAFMYQNITLIPLVSVDSQVNHIGVMIYDVTDMAVNKLRLELANDQLQSLSRTDRLTGLNNRGYWEECIAAEFERFRRTGQTCSLVMFDIDHFKKVNDTYGHQAGDEVIRLTADALVRNKRTTDIAGRYGGEEFAVILLDTPAQNARIFADRLRKDVEKLRVEHDGQTICYTISLGIAELVADLPSYKRWIESADQALYQAKKGGRNQTVIYTADIVSP